MPVTYLADSNHKWKYGHPIDINYDHIKKLQFSNEIRAILTIKFWFHKAE